MVAKAQPDPDVGDTLSAYIGDQTAQREGSQISINVDASDRSQHIENAPGGAIAQEGGRAAASRGTVGPSGEAQPGKGRLSRAPAWSRWMAGLALIVGAAAVVLFLVGEITHGAITAILTLIAIAVAAIPVIKG